MTAGVTVELPVHGRPVLLAGASARAISTAAALVDAGAVLSIACPSPAPYFDDLAERGLLTLHRREPTAADIGSAAIVFAHTGSREGDRDIARRAEQLDRLCICADGASSSLSTLIVRMRRMSSLRRIRRSISCTAEGGPSMLNIT